MEEVCKGEANLEMGSGEDADSGSVPGDVLIQVIEILP